MSIGYIDFEFIREVNGQLRPTELGLTWWGGQYLYCKSLAFLPTIKIKEVRKTILKTISDYKNIKTLVFWDKTHDKQILNNCGINVSKYSDDDSWFMFQQGLLDVLTTQPIDHILTIEKDAKDYLINWYRKRVKPVIETTDIPQVKSKCSKSLTEAIKIAQCLHQFHHHYCSIRGVAVQANSIHLETIKRACYLSEYLLKHFRYAYTITQESLIDGQLARILKIIEKKGEVTASNIHRALGGTHSKITLDRIPELLTQLIELKRITRVATHKGFKVTIAKTKQ